MALAIAVSLTGSPSETDIRAATLIVEQENERRAALDPPGTPLAVTPLGVLSTNYEGLLQGILVGAHTSYIQQSNERYITNEERVNAFKSASDSVRAQIDTLLGL